MNNIIKILFYLSGFLFGSAWVCAVIYLWKYQNVDGFVCFWISLIGLIIMASSGTALESVLRKL